MTNMNTVQIPATFDYHHQIAEVVMVGLGGTGSQAARSLSRIVYDLKRRGHHTPRLKFVDPDVIELKNTGRQMYLPAEIGQNKAVTLAKRFNLALGLQIVAYAEPFDPEKHVTRYGSLVVGCVDNHLARIALSQVNGLWLDSGNDRFSGQVSLGSTSDKAQIMRCIKQEHYTELPNAALLFPQLLEPESVTPAVVTPVAAESCAERLETAEQGLLVNDQLGIIVGEYLYKLLNGLPIKTFLTYVDTESLSMRSLPITAESLRAQLG